MQITLTLPDALFVPGDIVRIPNTENEKYIDVLIVHHSVSGEWYIDNGKATWFAESARYTVYTMQGSWYNDKKCTPHLDAGKCVVMYQERVEQGVKIGHNGEARAYYVDPIYHEAVMCGKEVSYETFKEAMGKREK